MPISFHAYFLIGFKYPRETCMFNVYTISKFKCKCNTMKLCAMTTNTLIEYESSQ